VFAETLRAGGGYKKFYGSWDAFALRTVAYTTCRVGGFLYFYDWLNPDPRRQARPDFYAYAALGGGLAAGFLSNPFEIVFTRMQVDEMYPEQCRRNYKNFADGLVKVAEEGALFRGALANGLRIGGILTCAAGIHDWIKENVYYFFGPIAATRLLGTAGGVAAAMALSMPFDTVRVRLHTMRPLPNGVYPYAGTADCISKIVKYECNKSKQANFAAFYTGGQAYAARLFVIALASQYLLDWYHATDNVSEFWSPARFHVTTGIDYDIHNPYTDAYNKAMVSSWMGKAGTPPMHPDGKSQIKVL
jgi:solute carrier family 25 oxoglutarate transporter 11